jgi:CRP-like cAMP-binding protein
MKEIKVDKMVFVDSLKKSNIFNMLKEEEIKDILDAGELFEYNEDEILIQEGDISSYMYVILNGVVSIIVKQQCDDNSIKDVYICTIGEGDIIGEAAIFSNVKRTAHAIAKMRLTVLRLERKQFFDFINSHPAAGIKILMLIILSLLNKLKEVNHELAFERKAIIEQDDIDSLMKELVK